MVDTTSKEAILGGYDFSAALMPAARWEAIKPAEVQATLAKGNPGVRTITRGQAKSYFIKPNNIFAFKTREGGMGILQIVGFSENPKGVKIRYKMVKSAKPAKTEIPWGEQVEGVQVRLRADKKVWKMGEIPAFKADVRNQGNLELVLQLLVIVMTKL